MCSCRAVFHRVGQGMAGMKKPAFHLLPTALILCLWAAALGGEAGGGAEFLIPSSAQKVRPGSKGPGAARIRAGHSRAKKTRGRAASSKLSRRGRRVRIPSKPGSMILPTRVLEIQQALIARGVLEQPASGQYDQATIDAMKVFQTREKIDVTGFPTAHALKRLGLSEAPTTQGHGSDGSNGSTRITNP